MILFLDTDVLIDLILDRKPFSIYSVKLLDHIQEKKIKSFIAWHSISNLYYLMSKELNKNVIKNFIKDILNFMKIPKTSNEELLLATKLDIRDFEDAMQIAAALAARADYIITRNTKDFIKSPITAITPKDFVDKFTNS